jgi:NAD(P)H-dependent flavin oxidoreductase YrpB (nitropropane dioxygenase family)
MNSLKGRESGQLKGMRRKTSAAGSGDVTVPVPIFQGGMGIGVSLSRLAAAVAKCGGVGTISAAQIGFMEPDFYTNPKEANTRA